MSTTKQKNIRHMVLAYLNPKLLSIYKNVVGYINNLLRKQIIFAGDSTGTMTLSDTHWHYELQYIILDNLSSNTNVFTNTDKVGISPYIVRNTVAHILKDLEILHLPADKLCITLDNDKLVCHYQNQTYTIDYPDTLALYSEVPLENNQHLVCIKDQQVVSLDSFVDTTDKNYLSKIKLHIKDDSHLHTAKDIRGVVKDTTKFPNSVVQRSLAGRIHGNGSGFNNTGFKLANGNDVSTLFKDPNQFPFTVTSTQEGYGNRLKFVRLTIDSSNYAVRLYTQGDNLCPWYGWNCNCDCC